MNKERYKYTTDIEQLSSFNDFSTVEKTIDAENSLYKERENGFDITANKSVEYCGLVRIDLYYPTGCNYKVENSVRMKSNSNLRLLIYHHNTDNVAIKSYLNIELDENAELEIVEIVDTVGATVLSDVKMVINRDSHAKLSVLDLNNQQVVRNQIVDLNGSGAECTLNGLYITGAEEKVDNYIKINHSVPHCTSNQLYKGVLFDSSRAAFTGHIYVAKDAQKTAAYQQNQNIVLTNQAEINSRPQLEIYADDVKCTHGATIGNIDPDITYYLRQRGISEQKAKRLQIIGFAQDVLTSIDDGFDDIKSIVNKKIIAKLEKIEPRE